MKYRSMLLASAVLQAGVANGMGLGNLEVQSYLGSPLKAEANLISPREFGGRDVQASIARVDVYDRFGARYEAAHSNLRFRVVEKADGELGLTITSANRVVEPFLDIVVELSWPEGTTYRRYNLLIDPPEYAARWQKPNIQMAPVESATRILVKEPKAVVEIDSVANVVPDIELGGQYLVQSGDSLWKIAKRTRKAAGLSIQQMMDVLYQQNPAAFIKGKKDKLMLGAVLQVPATRTMLAKKTQSNDSTRPRLDQMDASSYPQSEAVVQAEFIAQPKDRVSSEIIIAEQHSVIMDVTVDSNVVQQDEILELKQQLQQLQKERNELVEFQQAVSQEIAGYRGQQQQIKQALVMAEEAVTAVERPEQEIVEFSKTFEPASELSFQNTSIQKPDTNDLIVSPEAEEMKETGYSHIAMETLQSMRTTTDTVDTTAVVASTAHDLIGNREFSTNSLISNSGSGLWYILGMIPLGALIVLLGMRAHKVQEIKRSEEIKDEDLYDLVFGAKRDRDAVDSPEQLEKAMHQIREKADHFEELHSEKPAEEGLATKDDVSQMIELYMLYSQYQKALNVILTEISKRPARRDLRLYLMQVYAHMQDWKSFEDQMIVLERMGDESLLKEAESIRLSLKVPLQSRKVS